MLDIDKVLPITVSEIDFFLVVPYPSYHGNCPIYGTYSPGFPLIINGYLIGYPCGNCVTDIIEQLKKRNPKIIIKDTRKVLYN